MWKVSLPSLPALCNALPAHPGPSLEVPSAKQFNKLFQRYFMHMRTFTLFILYFLHPNYKQLHALFSAYFLLCLITCWKSYCSDTLLLYILLAITVFSFGLAAQLVGS